MVLRPVACGGSGSGQKRHALRRPLHRSRYFRRICAVAGAAARSFPGFRPGGRGLLAAIAGARRFSPGGGGREFRQRSAEGRTALLNIAQLASSSLFNRMALIGVISAGPATAAAITNGP